MKLLSSSSSWARRASVNGTTVLTVAAGDNTLRVLPPLNIEQAHIDEFVEKLSAGAASYQVPVAA